MTVAGIIGFVTANTTLAAGETKTFKMYDNEYSILISTTGQMNSLNSLFYASGYGVSNARNYVVKITGQYEPGITFGTNIKGFSLTNNDSVDVNLVLLFLRGSSFMIS